MERSASKEANSDAAAAPAEQCGSGLGGAKQEILMAINSLRSDFLTRLDGILNAVEETKKELVDCSERVTDMEIRLSTVEDEQAK